MGKSRIVRILVSFRGLWILDPVRPGPPVTPGPRVELSGEEGCFTFGAVLLVTLGLSMFEPLPGEDRLMLHLLFSAVWEPVADLSC